ncbi:MAG: glycosyltransferase family 2 protein [Methanosphaera sp.]|uniref:glycosyltransferase family 2 protein n=1 Tax=Methanosphaera sp. TaxID=2666342 RepID=UPI002E79A93E|nr:glycosyltransferase family 2 protein [Methanosphaera sp.]MEE1117082.1 glycosyltransferase family 2 protein [Methanosphaera sp.]MEE3323824.1 glycosyltransferase family 2 protein [Methanosphaera sp.]MEE3419154.1 glycosyltransferase family 2 protein [Methanosphaera sp.]
MKISFVIPALNEEGIVGKTIRSIPTEEIKEAGYEVEIIVVNNNSTDNTEQEAREAGATVFLEMNRGYGNAYKRGFKEATGDIFVMGDADGTYPLEQSLNFINYIVEDGSDFVIGSRFKGSIEEGAMPALHQYIGNPMLTKMLNILFHADYSDTHCGMRAFTREAYEKMDLKAPGMEFAIEMVIEAAEKNLNIKEVPISYRKRGGGEAKLSSFDDGWRHIKYMLTRKFN